MSLLSERICPAARACRKELQRARLAAAMYRTRNPALREDRLKPSPLTRGPEGGELSRTLSSHEPVAATKVDDARGPLGRESRTGCCEASLLPIRGALQHPARA